jgi:MFS family permease
MHRAYLLMFLGNIGISLSSLFIPLLARELGLSFTELGMIGMAYGAASVLSYSLFGHLSDVTRRRVPFVRLGLALAASAFTAQILMRDLLTMIAIRWLAGFAVGVFSFPLLAHLAGRFGYQKRIGWFAASGSLGWFAGYIAAGLLRSWVLAFLSSGLSFCLALALSLFLKESREPKVYLRSFWKVIKENSVVYASYLLRHTGAHAIWIVFPLFLIEKLGASLLWVGVLMALNTGSQFFFMGLIGRTAEPDEGRRLLRLGLLLSTVVFVSYYFSSYYLQLVPVQLLLGVAWSSLYVGSLLHLVEKNVERATSTGALGSTISLATMIGPFLGGLISEIFGMRAVFLVASALTLAGLVLSKRMTN